MPNSNDYIISNGNVILIEPNAVNINRTLNDGVPFVNGISQYQDMYIFAELTARSKGRSVSINGNWTGTNPISINLMGNADQQTPESPNYLGFTTNYYDGSTGNHTQYEGFGISSIKINISASFVPQINIQFVDLRGLAFFNQKDSPYRILFDFPPPTFTLTIKGYYGKPITYEIHLVKYTSEFNAENGNFIIDAQFVAMTFAPLADILLRYVVNVALIDDASSMNPDTSGPPNNTYELILKLKNLYSAIADKLKTDTESIKYDVALKELEYINSAMSILDDYKKNEILGSNLPYLIIKTDNQENFVEKSPATQENATSKIALITLPSEYGITIKDKATTGTATNLTNRLCLVFVAGTNNTPADADQWKQIDPQNPLIQPTLPQYDADSTRLTNLKKTLNDYRNTLIKNVNPALGISTKDISEATSFFSEISIANNTTQDTLTQYISLDVTNYYYKLYKKKLETEKKKNELSGIVTTKVNNMVSQRLGMIPSIYNIFSVILNDVDEFFKILRDTSEVAESAHKTDYSKITNKNNNDINGIKIYAFPLIIEDSNVYGGSKEERVAPIKLRDSGINFPELTMVDNFIDSFQTQKGLDKEFNLRSEQNDDGTYKWIPISPIDSTLGDASPESPYIGINNDVLPQIYKILLKRFYVLSQGIIYDDFYKQDGNDTAHKAYINLYAEAEGVNLASALSSTKNASKSNDLVKELARKYEQNPDLFYADVANTTDIYDGQPINLYDFPIDTPQYFPISPSSQIDGLVYVDKRNSEFKGVHLHPAPIEVQTKPSTESTSRPIDKFNSDAKANFLSGKNGLFGTSPSEYFYEFTQENVIYIRDVKDDAKTFNDVSLATRYITNRGLMTTDTQRNGQYPKSQIIAYENGNAAFGTTIVGDKSKLDFQGHVVNTWADELSRNDTTIYDTIIKSGSTLSALIFLSNFGYTLSPFNKYPAYLNTVVFNTPSAVEVPTYLPLYVGAIVDAVQGGWEDDVIKFFSGTTGDNGIGSDFKNMGYYILADLHDVKNYLSIKDSEVFRTEFLSYYGDGYPQELKRIQDLYDEVNANYGEGKRFASKSIAYEALLNPISTNNDSARGSFNDIIYNLIVRKNIINYSQITFQMSELNTYPIGYESLATSNNDVNKRAINKIFFQKLFGKLNQEIVAKEKSLKEQAEELKKVKADKDIITQTYYSFKTINDKWLSGPVNSNQRGYPFNKTGKNLIDSFAFVDRAMNPIGDTIINAEILVDMLNDPNISVFTALSQLLSLNGFEFFPLQNFMNVGGETSWEDSFKIQTGAIKAETSTAFVCMYIGGSSSYPSTAQNGFENDGITNIADPGVTDYFTKPVTNQGTVDDLQTTNNSDFPWRQVRAFRVRFGVQNQSMFTGIKIDSKEYPETNESIQILSRLAGDNKENAPTPKGQNLYNLYENRSYKATITGFGNAMIQPTQYFQLENIPLFNGAYIILNVEHNIDANKMTTTFSGTKLLKYPIPRVLNPAAFTGFNSDTSSTSSGEIVKGALISNDDRTKYNAMYTLKIE